MRTLWLLLPLIMLSPRCAAQDDVAALARVLKDPSASTQAKGAACGKLMEMGPKAAPAVPAIIPLLRSSENILRDYAISTLGAIGPGAVAALPELRRVAAGDPAQDLRQLANEAIQKIGAGGLAGGPAPPAGGKPPTAQPPAKQPAREAPPAAQPERTTPVRPGPPSGARPDASLIAAAFPELAHAPAPAFVKPGLRLT